MERAPRAQASGCFLEGGALQEPPRGSRDSLGTEAGGARGAGEWGARQAGGPLVSQALGTRLAPRPSRWELSQEWDLGGCRSVQESWQAGQERWVDTVSSTAEPGQCEGQRGLCRGLRWWP